MGYRGNGGITHFVNLPPPPLSADRGRWLSWRQVKVIGSDWEARSRRGRAGRCVFVDSPVEGQLGLEVGVFAVAVREILVDEQLGEDLDVLGLELRPGRAAQLGDRLVGAHGPPV